MLDQIFNPQIIGAIFMILGVFAMAARD